jgi:hypothetical protein
MFRLELKKSNFTSKVKRVTISRYESEMDYHTSKQNKIY